jgi:hypothetical protein
VSDEGRVRNVKTGRVLKHAITDRGYCKLSLGRAWQGYVHQLVAEAFIGPRPTHEHDVDHKDFDRTNNAAANLRWLHKLTNRVRWAGKQNGRNLWSTPDDPAPEDHEPMTQEEREQWEASAGVSGW